MAKNFLVIGVQTDTLEAIDAALKYPDAALVKNIIEKHINISVDIVDDTYALKFNAQFLLEIGVEAETEFFRNFDLTLFGRQLEFTYPYNFECLYLLEHSVFFLAGVLSRILQTRCIVMHDSFAVPVGLFENGQLIDDFSRDNAEFFKSKMWRPQLINKK